MKKTNKKLLSLLLAVLMLTGSIGVGFTVFADDPPHDCATEGHEYEMRSIKEEDATLLEDYLNTQGDSISNYAEGIDYFINASHLRICKYCNDITGLFRHNFKAGYVDDENGHHYIACQFCDIHYNEQPHQDITLDFYDSNGNLTTDGLCDICKGEVQHRYARIPGPDPQHPETATCVLPGYDSYQCLNCGEKYSEVVSPALGHSWPGQGSNNLYYSWDDKEFSWAKITFKCLRDNCDSKLEYTVYADSGNINNIIIKNEAESIAPSCTESGKDVYDLRFTIRGINADAWHGFELRDENNNIIDGAFLFTTQIEVETSPLDHDYSILVSTTEPTCTEDGVIKWKCSRCGDTTSTYSPALGHNFEIYTSDRNATCTKDSTQTSVCTRCQTVNTIPEAGTALGHDYSAEPVIENKILPSCIEKGSYDEVIYCTRCNVELTRTTKVIEATDVHTDDNSDNYCDICNKHLKHDFYLINSVDATCTTDGYNEYKCRGCEETYTEETNKNLGHMWEAGSEENEFLIFENTTNSKPSCTAKYICKRCGETATFTVYSEDEYNNYGKVELSGLSVAASCEFGSGTEYIAHFKIKGFYFDTDGTPGTLEYDHRFVIEDGVTEALGHDLGEFTVKTAPTCTESGLQTAVCSRCNRNVDQTIPPLGHKFTVYVDGTAATCTEAGNGTYKCERCDETQTGEIEPLGHEESEPVQENIVEPTCADKGSYDEVVYCSRCGEELKREQKETEATGEHADKDGDNYCDGCHLHLIHDFYLTDSVDATCTADGYNEYKCRGCETTYKEETNKNLGHLWDNSTKSMDTVTDTDYIKFTTDTTDIEKPSCTATYTCMRPGCDHTASFTVYYNDDLNNLGKVTLTNPHKPATCLFGSGIEYTAHFKITNFYFDQPSDLPGTLEYDYKFVVEDGIEDALGHDFGEYKVTTKATCTEEGIETRTCSRCGKVDSRAIPATGHDFSVLVSGTAATCTSPGSGEFKCSNCDETSKTTIPALGHDYKTTKAATCTENGEKVCSRCKDKKVIDKLGHIDDNSDGYCDRCNELFDLNAYNSSLFKNIRLSIRKPSTTIIPYGHTLRLYAETSKPLPKGYSLKWTMTGDGVTIIPSNDNSYCDVRATGKGNATVSVQIVDDAGNTPKFVNQSDVYRSQDVSTASTFFRMIAYFFKTLLRINTIIDK